MKTTFLKLPEEVHACLSGIAHRRGASMHEVLQALIEDAIAQEAARSRFINPSTTRDMGHGGSAAMASSSDHADPSQDKPTKQRRSIA